MTDAKYNIVQLDLPILLLSDVEPKTSRNSQSFTITRRATAMSKRTSPVKTAPHRLNRRRLPRSQRPRARGVEPPPLGLQGRQLVHHGPRAERLGNERARRQSARDRRRALRHDRAHRLLAHRHRARKGLVQEVRHQLDGGEGRQLGRHPRLALQRRHPGHAHAHRHAASPRRWACSVRRRSRWSFRGC